MIDLKVLTVNEAKQYFGSRFYEVFYSGYFHKKCEEDDSFKLMYNLLFELHGLFEKDSLIVGHAKMFKPQLDSEGGLK